MDYLYKIFTEKDFLTPDSEKMIATEIYREILPEFYNIIRHFEINKRNINAIKNNTYYTKLLKNPNSKEIIKLHNIKQRIAFFLFTKVL